MIYRNYIPLNQPYSSFWLWPPKDVIFDIPKPVKFLKFFFPFYQRFGRNVVVKKLIKIVQKFIFDKSIGLEKSFDVAFYIGMLPENKVNYPYLVDLEHISMLLNNSSFTQEDKAILFQKLNDKNCKGIVPISIAAKKTLEKFLGKNYEKIKNKVEVVYPAVPNYKKLYKDEIDYSILGSNKEEVKILFVGKDGFRKGIHEVLSAFDILSRKYKNIKLVIVSDPEKELIEKYKKNSRILFFEGKFPYQELIKKIFLPSDIFVMPTHADSFGMVYLDALSSGLPVILTHQFATPEIVQDEVNGLFLKHKTLILDEVLIPQERFGKDYKLEPHEEKNMVNELVEKIEYLISNPKVRKKMSDNATNEFEKNGKFSVEVRNNKLTKIFKEAISES